MAQLGRIEATLSPGACRELERFLVHSRMPGAMLTLFKSTDDPSGDRWSYGVLTPERLNALRTAMETRGRTLVYTLDNLSVAISNPGHAKELDGTLIELDGPGYLLVRAVAPPAP